MAKEFNFSITMDDVNKAIDELKKDLNNGKFENDFSKSLYGKQSIDLSNIMQHCVDVYYNRNGETAGYTPKKYKRKLSLYEMYKITQNGIDYRVQTGSQFTDIEHRVDNDYIFDKMWMEGWHGGATYSDKLDMYGNPYPPGYEMAYRKTPKGGPRFALWHTMPVVKTKPIEKMAEEEINAYEDDQNNFSGNTATNRFYETAVEILSKYSLFNFGK